MPAGFDRVPHLACQSAPSLAIAYHLACTRQLLVPLYEDIADYVGTSGLEAELGRTCEAASKREAQRARRRAWLQRAPASDAAWRPRKRQRHAAAKSLLAWDCALQSLAPQLSLQQFLVAAPQLRAVDWSVLSLALDEEAEQWSAVGHLVRHLGANVVARNDPSQGVGRDVSLALRVCGGMARMQLVMTALRAAAVSRS